MSLKSGHWVTRIQNTELDGALDKIKCYKKKGLVRLEPGGWVHFPGYPIVADRIYDFKVRESDVYVLSYPKCGTTWVLEILWTLRNNLSFNNPETNVRQNLKTINMHLDEHYMIYNNIPHAEYEKMFRELLPNGDPDKGMIIQIAESLPDPRTLKCHLPLSLLPANLLQVSKAVFISRNPFDTCVSYHHFHKISIRWSYEGNMDEFVDAFINEKLMFSPYWGNLKEAWDRRTNPNFLLLFYEDMKKDPREGLLRICRFLGIELTEEQIEKVLDFTSFEAMKKRGVYFGVPDEQSGGVNMEVFQKDGGFFRSGTVGSWKSKLTVEQAEKIKKWSLKNLEEFDDAHIIISKWFEGPSLP